MGLITEKITYNVRQRGRKARGQDRNFNTPALAKLINGSAVQEMVKHGDMLGYLGHWPRVKFGIATVEGGIDQGKAISTPIAVRTIELSADNDGNITHRTEFLDTEHGQAAQKIYESKAGGFSSAISPYPGTSPILPRDFHGFDFVYEPNFSANRGHSVILDGVQDVTGLLDAVALYAAGESEMADLFKSLHGQHMTALETMERLARENDELISRIASGARVLDSAILDGATRIAPVRGTPGEDFERFRGADLVRLQELPSDEPSKPTPESGYLMARYGIKL